MTILFIKEVESRDDMTFKRKTTYEETLHAELMRDIAKTKCALDCAYSNFDNVVDPDLIDCYIYEVNAVQKRYKFLLDRAVSLNLMAPFAPEVREYAPELNAETAEGSLIT